MNLGRRRTLVAIGTHDLDTLKPPFTYFAKPPQDIKFKPLNQHREFVADELMQFYKCDNNLKAYLHILEEEPLFPVIYDANNVVLSMPPIINGDHSKMSVSTKNIFIECTATDLTKAKIVLNTIVTLFSEYCADKFTVEPVDVVQANGDVTTYPTFSYRSERISSQVANNKIGIGIPPQEIAQLLTKMCLTSQLDADGDSISVTIPPTRADILHPCDIYEDIAIAHGYNNIKKIIPQTNTVAHQFPVNKLSDKLKENIAMAGFTEIFTFSLCSKNDISVNLGRELDSVAAVTVANPATIEFQVVRTTLIPGLLKTVSSNRKMPLPLKLFEISDVVLLDESSEVGARNERRLAAIFYGRVSGFEVVHGLLDRVMQLLEVNPFEQYRIEAADDAMYFPDRCARVVLGDQQLGMFGILHPDVLKHYDLPFPCTVLELNLESFVC
jgi:phenylalanyl-tRNA synthetase beta chain